LEDRKEENTYIWGNITNKPGKYFKKYSYFITQPIRKATENRKHQMYLNENYNFVITNLSKMSQQFYKNLRRVN